MKTWLIKRTEHLMMREGHDSEATNMYACHDREEMRSIVSKLYLDSWNYLYL